jgi:uncharacterized protein
MGRILFFLLLAIALYVGYRLWRAGPKRAAGQRTSEAGDAAEPMVRCDHCGLNLPQSEAVGEAGRWFCSDAHRALGRNGR